MQECGICNGWEEMAYRCSACKGEMEDHGRIEDRQNEYSHSAGNRAVPAAEGEHPDTEVCLHLFICRECGHEDIVRL